MHALTAILAIFFSFNSFLLFSFAQKQGEDTSDFYSIEQVSDITVEDIDRLLEYRRTMEYESHGWTKEDYNTEGPLREFYSELLRKWVRPFDWRSWRAQAWEYYKSPDSLEDAQLEEIVKTLTFHVRMDRFCEGHLLSLIQHGHMGEILQRLRKLRVGLAKQTAREAPKEPVPQQSENSTELRR